MGEGDDERRSKAGAGYVVEASGKNLKPYLLWKGL